jgi:sirohydrochlorin ferrochelatase
MDAILLVDHGSRLAEANDKLGVLASQLEEHLERAGRPTIVGFAHMELARPSVAEAVGDAVRRGATTIVCVPCFLSRGRHVTVDIPRLCEEALRAHPGIGLVMASPLSEQPGFLDLLAQAGGAR